MARVRDIVVDCVAPAALARFRADVLDGYAVAPYDADRLPAVATLEGEHVSTAVERHWTRAADSQRKCVLERRV